MRRACTKFAQPLTIVCAVVALAACKKSVTTSDDYEGIGKALNEQDQTGKPPAAARPQPAALPGVDTSRLDDDQKQRLGQLVDTLASPCGKAHSLRTSLEEDTACRRALFAARYVARLVAEDYDQVEIRAYYDMRYRSDPQQFNLASSPFKGSKNARVTIVEFLDYG